MFTQPQPTTTTPLLGSGTITQTTITTAQGTVVVTGRGTAGQAAQQLQLKRPGTPVTVNSGTSTVQVHDRGCTPHEVAASIICCPLFIAVNVVTILCCGETADETFRELTSCCRR